MNAGAKERRAPARGRTLGRSLLVPFWRLKKGLAVRAKPPAANTAETDMYTITTKNMVGPKAAIAGKPAPTIALYIGKKTPSYQTLDNVKKPKSATASSKRLHPRVIPPHTSDTQKIPKSKTSLKCSLRNSNETICPHSHNNPLNNNHLPTKAELNLIHARTPLNDGYK
jgi:hypothetical protein